MFIHLYNIIESTDDRCTKLCKLLEAGSGLCVKNATRDLFIVQCTYKTEREDVPQTLQITCHLDNTEDSASEPKLKSVEVCEI